MDFDLNQYQSLQGQYLALQQQFERLKTKLQDTEAKHKEDIQELEARFSETEASRRLAEFHAVFTDLIRAHEYHDHNVMEHIVNSYRALLEKERR